MDKKWAQFLPHYSVSNYGEIMYIPTGKLRTPQKRNWYLSVYIAPKNYSVHKLVASYFVPGNFQGAVVGHIDHNPYNNRADNLIWCTQKQNIAEQLKRGTHTSQWSEKSKECRNKANKPSRIRGLGKSGIKGITILNGPRGTRYRVSLRSKYLGTFSDLNTAKKVYDEAHFKMYNVRAY